ncbi:MAG TPA: PxKF domain-containing protein, partial [Candidatus Manganitrophaceae bacterium]|nr:PxKF domain-containing protein [Candidatus Manganitrophaceae bacterium]
GGIVTTNITRDDQAASISLQADGKIVVAGITDLYLNYNTVFAMVRYRDNGEIDSSFGENGRVITDIGPGPEGISTVLIQEDRKLVAVGSRDGHYFAIARYDSDGVLDPSFGTGGIISVPLSLDGSPGEVRSAALQPDGKIVVAGSAGGDSALYGTNSDALVARFRPDGTLDAGFGNGGRVLTDVGKGTDEIASGLVIDRGRMIVGGHIYRFNASTNRKQFDFLLLRYLSDGRLDPAFGDGGHAIVDFGLGGDDLVYALSLQASGKIVLAGESVRTATGRDFALARFLNEPIDTAPPVTETALFPAPNAAGWNHTDVRLTLSASDPGEGTGVKEIHYAIGEGPEAIVAGATAVLELTSEGIFEVRYYAVDLGDNAEASRSILIRMDKTGPAVVSSQSPAANSAGWNKGRVTVDFAGEDALSGGGLCNPASISVATEGAHQSIQSVCADVSGNQTVSAREVNIDQSPPALTLPPLASTYPLNSTISLSYGADDPLSGVALISAMLDGDAVSNGARVTFNKPGPHTFVLTATDRAGNSASQSRSFTVGEPSEPSFTFLPPLIVQGGRKVFELGSTIPVKFRLTDTNGSPVSSAVARLSLQYYLGGKPVGAPIPAISHGHFNSGDLFRFNGEHYSYELNTKPLSKGIWELRVSLSDGSVHAVMIELKSGGYVERCCAGRSPHCFLNEGKGDDEKE